MAPPKMRGRQKTLICLYGVGVPLLRRLVTAVTSYAGAKDFSNMTMLGTPSDGHSPGLAPLI